LATRCPTWLCRTDVLASLGLDEAKRRGYEAYMEGRVLELGNKSRREELEEQWRVLRRGWYLGEEGFLDKLKGLLEKAVGGAKAQSRGGDARRQHDLNTAEELVVRGMRILGMKEKDLVALGRSAPEKAVLAWWVRKQTTAPLKWVSARLQMGHYTSVTQAVARVRNKPARKTKALKRKLELRSTR
ncbi:MAG TPA: hypothetical protein VHH88_13355, partial [Verrucomicrobiae bacterium]|nr:hypothetical protein [Verrucomicrobiae bacterium]